MSRRCARQRRSLRNVRFQVQRIGCPMAYYEPLAVKRWSDGQRRSVRQPTDTTGSRINPASDGIADTFCSLLAYAKRAFV